MFKIKKRKILKRWRNLEDKLVITAQSEDLRLDKVRKVIFYFDKKTFQQLKDSKITYDFSNFYIVEKGLLVELSAYYETKKLTNVNENAYLQYKENDAYRFSEFISVSGEIIKGVDIRSLIHGYYENKLKGK